MTDENDPGPPARPPRTISRAPASPPRIGRRTICGVTADRPGASDDAERASDVAPRREIQHAIQLAELWAEIERVSQGHAGPEDLDAATNKYSAACFSVAPEQKAAIIEIATGAGSAESVGMALRSAWHLLQGEVHSHDPRIAAMLKLVLNPNDRDGFNDLYWTPQQMLLWATTGNRWAVQQASNDSGRLGEEYAQRRAAVVIAALGLSTKNFEHSSDELRRLCLAGRVKAMDDQGRSIPAADWIDLAFQIEDDGLFSCVGAGPIHLISRASCSRGSRLRL